MARMIPPACLAKTPMGEKELFNKLRDDPNTVGWVVLHSLDVKKHKTKIEGELDMVVIVPGQGVLCLEVKGCNVSRLEGKWIYPYETSFEGPFKQVSKSMHSLRSYLTSRDCTLSGLLFFSAAVFTRIDFDEKSPEWHPWQFINRHLFLRQPISVSISNIMQRAHEHIASRVGSNSWYNNIDSRPHEGQVKNMVSLLRDNFEYAVSPRSDLESLEQIICQFTEEQFHALDLLEFNDRLVFKGPAGTGKTFLAMEAAKRALANGMRVLFVCYNNLLGDWLQDKTSGYSEYKSAFECRTFHSLLLQIAGEKPPIGAGSDYWKKSLPLKATDRLLDNLIPWASFDMIVVDEAQDLLEEEYLDVFDLLLKGGLAGGKWALFGDFERQAIYSEEGGVGVLQSIEALSGRAPIHSTYPLRINCRNAEPIAETLAITSGLVPGYKRVLHDIAGSEVDPLFYFTIDDQQKQLVFAIRSLRETFKPGEIIVLSMRNDENACAGVTNCGEASLRLAPIRRIEDAQTIPFASIHAFKGLEAPAVIITDIESLNDEKSRALLYVGMSRARIRLYMLMHESCRSTYNSILDAGFQPSPGK